VGKEVTGSQLRTLLKFVNTYYDIRKRVSLRRKMALIKERLKDKSSVFFP
jgi:hypothetical protein